VKTERIFSKNIVCEISSRARCSLGNAAGMLRNNSIASTKAACH